MNRKSSQVINAGGACVTKEGVWFVHYVLRILMFYDFSKRKITKAKVIPETDDTKIGPCLALLENNGRIYLWANNAGNCYIYDVDRDCFSPLRVLKLKNNNFRSVYRMREYAYVIPYRYNKVLKVDLNTDEIAYIDGFRNLFSDTEREKVYINYSYMLNEKEVVNAVPHTDSILIFNMQNEKWRRIRIENGDFNISCITADEHNMYAFDCLNKRLVKLDLEGHVLKYSDSIGFDGVYLWSIHNGCIVVDDAYGSKMRIYDSEFEIVKEFEFDIIESTLSSEYKQGCWFDLKDIICGISKSNEIVYIDKENNVLIVPLTMEDGLWEKISMEYAHQFKYGILERELVRLEKFIEVVSD